MPDRKKLYYHLLAIIGLLPIATMTHAQLLDLTKARSVNELWVVNDGVMGGLSESRFSHDTDGVLFEGVVSLDNGGGFASLRSTIVIPMGTTALDVTVRGNKKQYKLIIRTDPSPRAPMYQADFTATPAWKIHRFQASDFKASFRGRPVDAPELVFADVREIGILIANKQAGAFKVQIKNIQSAGDTPR